MGKAPVEPTVSVVAQQWNHHVAMHLLLRLKKLEWLRYIEPLLTGNLLTPGCSEKSALQGFCDAELITRRLYWPILLATLFCYVVLTQSVKMWLVRKARL